MKGENEAENDAVSPVISVVLMLAIVVILSAVIGATVLGFAGSIDDPPRAVVTVQDPGSDSAVGSENYIVRVTNTGNLDGAYIRDPDGRTSINLVDALGPATEIQLSPFTQPYPASFDDPDGPTNRTHCLVTRHGGFSLNGLHVPHESPLPCNGDSLPEGMESDEQVAENLPSGTYHLIGRVGGRESVVRSFHVS